MSYIFTEGLLNSPAQSSVVDHLISNSFLSHHIEYIDFLRTHNGGEGFVSDNYIVLWKAEELIEFNIDYEVEKYAPGVFLFGTNGGDDGYGFDTRSEYMPIVRIPLIGMDRRYAEIIATDFRQFFLKLSEPS